MMEYGDPRCKACEKMKQVEMKCYCICHTTDYVDCEHERVWAQDMQKIGGKYFHWFFRFLSKRKGEKFEIF